ncbi:DUF2314 domain-containing protein [Rhizobium binae]|uniref:DUF2314 domain-containing protein n=1 Tax=Rhizobium binae TaxID=1138190 RepID=UPI001FEF29F8|nr:DUF2314 domain-containing protein [Rhizobium binae]
MRANMRTKSNIGNKFQLVLLTRLMEQFWGNWMLRGVLLRLLVLALSIQVVPTEVALADNNSNVQRIAADDPAMAKAHEKSLKDLDAFLEKLRNPPPGTGNYNIKLGFIDTAEGVALITDQKTEAEAEFMWVGQIQVSGDHFAALLGDTPETVHNIKSGDRVQFAKSDIFDWVYFDNGKIRGNYTDCPLLLAGPKAELEIYRLIFGLVCD